MVRGDSYRRVQVDEEMSTASGAAEEIRRLPEASASPRRLQKAASLASAPAAASTTASASASTSTPKGHVKSPRRKQHHLFPCPLVKTLDLDSPDNSPSTLGIVSGLDYYSVPFASSTSYTLACQQQRRKRGLNKRVKSVQSPTGPTTPRVITSASNGSWPQRQHSLPIQSSSFKSTPTNSTLGFATPITSSALRVSPNSKSPQVRVLKQAKSLHAQTHKLKRQVTICEDSVSIPDSQLFLSRQCSVAESVSLGLTPAITSSVSPQYNTHSPKPSPNRSPSRVSQPPQQQQQQLLRQESSFTQEEISSLQEAFAQLDTDGNGKLSRKEAEAALGQVLSEADLDYFLLDMKTDENGEVAWQDFLRAMKERMREPESVKMLKEAFRVVAGEPTEIATQPTISAERIKHSLMLGESKATEQEVEEMLKVLDLDHDGEIQMEDFVRLLVSESNGSNFSTTSCAKCIIL